MPRVSSGRQGPETELPEDDALEPRTERHQRRFACAVVLMAVLLLPAVTGGCPEFRNQLVDATETAALGILLADEEPCAAFEAAGRQVIGAALGLIFDQFRIETTGF